MNVRLLAAAFVAASISTPAMADGGSLISRPWKQAGPAHRSCQIAAYAAKPDKPVRNFGNLVRISGTCPRNFVNGQISGNRITMGGVTYEVVPGATSGTRVR